MSDIEKRSHIVEAETFRDSIGTAEASGKRKWVYTKKSKGKYTIWRKVVAFLLLLFLFVCPFIKIGGNPLFKFDILNREFFVFGVYFSTTDLFLLAITMIVSIVFVLLFTVIYGRLFCGWVCPQTILMEHIFRPIEYLIEGDRNKRIKLDNTPWTTDKLFIKATKWGIYILISIVLAQLFLAYIVGIEVVLTIYKTPSSSVGVITAVIILAGLIYLVFAWLREQVCTFLCPYGRLQGVLVDKNTINVAYDYKRGEREAGRAKWKKGQDRASEGIGDCIDCNNCVIVCPTGIDIRQGSSQLECVNCTACIDACDEVMEKVGYPTGLIKYASDDMLETGSKFKLTTRVIAYTLVLLALLGLLAASLFTRSSIESKFLKTPSTLYLEKGEYIEDSYDFMLINKTNEPQVVKIEILNFKTAKLEIVGYGNEITVPAQDMLKGRALIQIPKKDLKSSKEKIDIGIFDNGGKKIDEYSTTFAAPFKKIKL